jgi:hypothetical protein
MEAALLHGDLPRAIRLAEHYAGRPDPDLRLHAGALLCIDGRGARGLEQVESVERARAAKRNASMARNFGAARIIVQECALRADLEPPPVPGYSGAGEWDQRERYAVLRLRRAAEQPGCADPQRLEQCSDPKRLTAAAEAAMNLLGAGMALDFRLELAASVAPFLDNGATALELVRSREGEPAPVARTPLSIRRLVERDEPGQPAVHPDQLTRAAEHLLRLRPRHAEMELLAGAMLARAAAGYAGLGQRDRALDRAERAAPLTLKDEVGEGLFESSVAFIAGDAEWAIQRLRTALAARSEADPVVAAGRIQLAELLASVGRHDDGLTEAVRADEAARQTANPVLIERAAWVRLALEDRHAAKARSDTSATQDVPVGQLPWLGPREGLVSEKARRQMLRQTLETWRRWIAAEGSARIAQRYAAYRGRGDAPEARVAHLFIAGLLADSPGQIEPWLDAFYALDATKLSLRGYAWARAGAAQWRGDATAARLWLKRYRTLERWAQDPANAELFQRLRL